MLASIIENNEISSGYFRLVLHSPYLAENTKPGQLVMIKVGENYDPLLRRPMLANITGGLSGPAIKPIALRMVWQAAKAVDIPIIGIGGTMNAQDALEFIIVGTVQIGTANFIDPSISVKILKVLKIIAKKM